MKRRDDVPTVCRLQHLSGCRQRGSDAGLLSRVEPQGHDDHTDRCIFAPDVNHVLTDSSIAQREVFFGEAQHWPALLVEHRDVALDNRRGAGVAVGGPDYGGGDDRQQDQVNSRGSLVHVCLPYTTGRGGPDDPLWLSKQAQKSYADGVVRPAARINWIARGDRVHSVLRSTVAALRGLGCGTTGIDL